MTDLPNSEAKTFLEDWAVNEYENASPEEALNMLTKLAQMVDKEFKLCSPKSEKEYERDFYEQFKGGDNSSAELKEEIIEIKKKRVALWVVLLGGMKSVLAQKGEKCNALNVLFDELINRVRGVVSNSAFDIPRKSRVLDYNKIWLRAQVIVVLEKDPDRRDDIIRNAERLLGVYEPAVSKMVDNFKSGKEPRADLVNLIKVAREHYPTIIDVGLLPTKGI
jgi:hypothetical protein